MRGTGDHLARLLLCGLSGREALTFSRRLGQDADRRVGETAQFVLAVMAPGSLDPCGRGIRKIQKVRLLHAAIRHLVTGSGRWDVADDGVPICQEDLVGTLLSFSWIVVDARRKLGVRIDDAELTREIARRNHRRSDEGILMTRALFSLHANSLRSGFEGAAPALTRYLLDDEVCALVGLPRTRWDRAMNWQSGVGRVLDRAQSARGPVGSLTKMVGAGILNQRVVGMAGRPSASFSIPVPPELHRRWTASGVFPQLDPELIAIARAQQAS